MSFRTQLIFAASLLISTSSNVFAQTPCDQPLNRQFDFWIGDWEVTTPQGKVAGNNSITRSLNGCVLNEHYKTPSGYEGTSFNIYDKQTQKWHQTWVDNTGLLLKLDGQFKDNNMVLTGPGKMQDGSDITHRISWTPNSDGTVRQHWEISKDNGETWSTAFDGLYTKKTSSSAGN